MIEVALQFLTAELNAYLASKSGSNPPEVVKMGRVVDDTGKYALPLDSVGATVINIEEDRILRSQRPDYVTVAGQHIVLEPELKLNLYILFCANFKRYDAGLKYLSLMLTFFQSHPVFTSTQHPALDRGISKLTAELQSLSFEQLNQIWGFIGGKQLPSVLYKIRLITLQDSSQKAMQPPVGVVHRQYTGK